MEAKLTSFLKEKSIHFSDFIKAPWAQKTGSTDKFTQIGWSRF